MLINAIYRDLDPDPDSDSTPTLTFSLILHCIYTNAQYAVHRLQTLHSAIDSVRVPGYGRTRSPQEIHEAGPVTVAEHVLIRVAVIFQKRAAADLADDNRSAHDQQWHRPGRQPALPVQPRVVDAGCRLQAELAQGVRQRQRPPLLADGGRAQHASRCSLRVGKLRGRVGERF